MSPSRGAARRSGDPRKRTAQPVSPARRGSRLWAVGAALAVGAAALVLALVAVDGEEEARPDAEARRHAAAACDLTTKAGEAAEAAQVDPRARYAAAVLLLDRAIIESARAAESDAGLADLDEALQAVHTAGHAGDHDRWEATLDTAVAECRTVLG